MVYVHTLIVRLVEMHYVIIPNTHSWQSPKTKWSYMCAKIKRMFLFCGFLRFEQNEQNEKIVKFFFFVLNRST